jgi:hypothetical protein
MFDGTTVAAYLQMLLGKNDLQNSIAALHQLDSLGQCPLNPTQLCALLVAIPQVKYCHFDAHFEHISAIVQRSAKSVIHAKFCRQLLV